LGVASASHAVGAWVHDYGGVRLKQTPILMAPAVRPDLVR